MEALVEVSLLGLLASFGMIGTHRQLARLLVMAARTLSDKVATGSGAPEPHPAGGGCASVPKGSCPMAAKWWRVRRAPSYAAP